MKTSTLQRRRDGKRVLMTGMRKGGDTRFQFRIFGNPASPFPPLMLKMSLHELQSWLREAHGPPAGPHERRTPHLRPVG